jgi:hypothetical protein
MAEREEEHWQQEEKETMAEMEEECQQQEEKERMASSAVAKRSKVPRGAKPHIRQYNSMEIQDIMERRSQSKRPAQQKAQSILCKRQCSAMEDQGSDDASEVTKRKKLARLAQLDPQILCKGQCNAHNQEQH